MFFSAAKRAFTLLYAMLSRCATHESIFVNSGFYSFHFHYLNITYKRAFVKRQCGTHMVWHGSCGTLRAKIEVSIVCLGGGLQYPLRGLNTAISCKL